MTVRELAEWLAAFEDQDAVVKVIVHQRGSGYYDQGGIAAAVEFNPELHAEYTDLRNNPLIPPDAPYYGKRTLLLGEIDG